jgi:prepilin signal peptidase PulO-like enzyme (type II secretory pathway)
MFVLDYQLYAILPQPFWAIFIFLGAALGSFFNVLAIRWPAWQIAKNNRESTQWVQLIKGKVSGLDITAPLPLLAGRSQCPSCKKKIPMGRNIPLLSWLMLGGKSACCKKPISPVYLLMEALGAVVFAVAAFTVGPTVYGLIIAVLVMLMFLMARIDAIDGFVPDALLFVSFILAYTLTLTDHWVTTQEAFVAHCAMFFGLYCIFQGIGWLTKTENLGMADYHLFSLSAVLLGPQVGWVLVLFIPCLIVTQLCKSISGWQPGVFAQLVGAKAIPAGPAIVASTVLVMAGRYSGFI